MDFSTKICVICLGISIITLFTLLLSSFNSLEVNEYGLDYSSISKSIGKKPYSAGIHFLGVGHSFIKFPKTVLNLEYSNHQGADYGPIRSRTSDGLEVILEISFQYKLIYEDLFELYNNYRENYSNIFSHIAIHTLTENTTEYTAYNFFVDIQRIGVKMQEALNKQFKIYCYSTIEFFNQDLLIYLMNSKKLFKFPKLLNKIFKKLKLKKVEHQSSQKLLR
ncbi:SPFH domain band 7 family protein [Ichthyophthirius multifiliis]|uniref:SPFH domain band 7 family protein n=1 Tax=Ichthyophthirius multifiliis TaxID=5932 RepID=G0R5W4_ICHMU|nr:SPFH domain band 7 family protein [Ichthyophthirius multifiliis]EGR27141.1 SPFH domain band 7 family protein [Ichthyophthirius multifiliis]|eukprot:XP_004024025.1 SPFH domain band 7 family protein [Ichthyophthirius multifiliis]